MAIEAAKMITAAQIIAMVLKRTHGRQTREIRPLRSAGRPGTTGRDSRCGEFVIEQLPSADK